MSMTMQRMSMLHLGIKPLPLERECEGVDKMRWKKVNSTVTTLLDILSSLPQHQCPAREKEFF